MWLWMLAATVAATDVNFNGINDHVDQLPVTVTAIETSTPPTTAGMNTLTPADEDIPFRCGSPHCECGGGFYFACTEPEKGDIIAYFDTRDYVGGTAGLHFTTGITPYDDQSITFAVHVNDLFLMEWSFDGCSGIQEFVEEFYIESGMTEVRWTDLGRDNNWLLLGVEDCDASSTDSYLVARPASGDGLEVFISGTPGVISAGDRFPMSVNIVNTGDDDAMFDEAKVYVTGPTSHTANAYDGADITVGSRESVSISKNRRAPWSSPSGDYTVEVVIYDDGTEVASDQVAVTVE